MNLLILHVKKSSNIFHSSVDGYECHSDGLQEILSESSINFDVVCLSETSQQSNHVSSIPQKWNTNHIALKKPPPPIRLVCSVQILGVLPHAVTKLCSLQADSQILKWNTYIYIYIYIYMVYIWMGKQQLVKTSIRC